MGKIVPEHGHIQLADDGGGVHGGIGGGNLGSKADGEGVAPPRDAQQDEVLGALVGLGIIAWAIRVSARSMSAWLSTTLGEYNLGRNRCFWNRSQRSSPLSPPHGTELKKGLFAFQLPQRGPAARRRRHAFNLSVTRLGFMTTNEPAPAPGPPPRLLRASGQRYRSRPTPTWMARSAGYYRRAPAKDPGAFEPALPSGPFRAAPNRPRFRRRCRAGAGRPVLAFFSLFLVLPFLLGRTGISGFVIGFIASLIPLGIVLLTVRFIDRWEPEPSRCCVRLRLGRGGLDRRDMLLQPFFAVAEARLGAGLYGRSP